MRAALRDRVLGIDVVAAHGATRVLPGASAVLGIQLRGRVRADGTLLASAGVTGILPEARHFTYEAETVSVLVRFTPQGATCLGLPASELANASVALEDLLPAARVAELVERTQAARDPVAVVEMFLLGLPFEADALVAVALERLATQSVAEVARSVRMSERQLERRMLARVGIAPKRYAALRRFERAVALLRTSPTLTAAAHAAGYYDQSHFVRDFRRFAGTSPSAFVRDLRDVGIVQAATAGDP